MAQRIPKTLSWIGELPGTLRMIDQTRLPEEFVEIDCETVEQVWQAIKRLSVRGAPAIGVSAAYGTVIGLQDVTNTCRSEFDQKLNEVTDYLASSRPTAVNLFWALERMKNVASGIPAASPAEVLLKLLEEARAIESEDREMCAAIGRHGAPLMPNQGGVLTHCNAGGLATAGDGTALSVLFAAASAGKKIHVFADETRPLLQGARLTAWECQQRDVPVTVICDSMAALVMREKKVQAVVTGADRIAANGDAANKVGTYSVAVLAKAHGVPFYVAAPSSTFDLSLASGDLIPIEERTRDEISHGFGKQTVPDGVDVWNPAFDVTPAAFIAGIITERGVIAPVSSESVAAMLGT
ncbi:MAG: S-methyl-5-thioribose-1-phosphate isomerase [Planctomycetota bacterium]|nr:S-methyl-5-thioribose-1-phosphate isomerase [Planctomycetota bacterium]MDA0919762.1 S-methyl-5-thioribose-1-phosphate isomerase [Planctomycetota bacterium]MDA1161042.1 S-methyl-5-thioribose-1-phosphate isomerase [Planctomycetota bacterium]